EIMGLNISKQPFDDEKCRDCGSRGSKQEQHPILALAMLYRTPGLYRRCGKKSRYSQQKRVFRCLWSFDPPSEREQDRRSGTRKTRKYCRRKLSNSEEDRERPSKFSRCRFFIHEILNNEDGNTSQERGECHWHDTFGQLKPKFLEQVSPGKGEY